MASASERDSTWGSFVQFVEDVLLDVTDGRCFTPAEAEALAARLAAGLARFGDSAKGATLGAGSLAKLAQRLMFAEPPEGTTPARAAVPVALGAGAGAGAALVGAIRAHAADAAAAAACASALAYLAGSSALFSALACDAGAAEAIIAASRDHHPSNPKVLSAAVLGLVGLLRRQPTRGESFAALGAADLARRALEGGGEVADVGQSLLELLGASPEDAQAAQLEEDALDVGWRLAAGSQHRWVEADASLSAHICDGMRGLRSAHSAGVAPFACEALAKLAAARPEELLAAGGMGCVAQALAAHPADAPVVDQACIAAVNMMNYLYGTACTGNLHGQPRVLAPPGSELLPAALVGAMASLPTEEGSLMCCCKALTFYAGSSPAAAAAACAAGAMEAAVAAMRAHPGSGRLQLAACEAIAHIVASGEGGASDAGSQARARAAGAVDAAACAAAAHGADSKMRTYTYNCLRALGLGADEQCTAIRAASAARQPVAVRAAAAVPAATPLEHARTLAFAAERASIASWPHACVGRGGVPELYPGPAMWTLDPQSFLQVPLPSAAPVERAREK